MRGPWSWAGGDWYVSAVVVELWAGAARDCGIRGSPVRVLGRAKAGVMFSSLEAGGGGGEAGGTTGGWVPVEWDLANSSHGLDEARRG